MNKYEGFSSGLESGYSFVDNVFRRREELKMQQQEMQLRTNADQRAGETHAAAMRTSDYDEYHRKINDVETRFNAALARAGGDASKIDPDVMAGFHNDLDQAEAGRGGDAARRASLDGPGGTLSALYGANPAAAAAGAARDIKQTSFDAAQSDDAAQRTAAAAQQPQAATPVRRLGPAPQPMGGQPPQPMGGQPPPGQPQPGQSPQGGPPAAAPPPVDHGQAGPVTPPNTDNTAPADLLRTQAAQGKVDVGAAVSNIWQGLKAGFTNTATTDDLRLKTGNLAGKDATERWSAYGDPKDTHAGWAMRDAAINAPGPTAQDYARNRGSLDRAAQLRADATMVPLMRNELARLASTLPDQRTAPADATKAEGRTFGGSSEQTQFQRTQARIGDLRAAINAADTSASITKTIGATVPVPAGSPQAAEQATHFDPTQVGTGRPSFTRQKTDAAAVANADAKVPDAQPPAAPAAAAAAPYTPPGGPPGAIVPARPAARLGPPAPAAVVLDPVQTDRVHRLFMAGAMTGDAVQHYFSTGKLGSDGSEALANWDPMKPSIQKRYDASTQSYVTSQYLPPVVEMARLGIDRERLDLTKGMFIANKEAQAARYRLLEANVGAKVNGRDSKEYQQNSKENETWLTDAAKNSQKSWGSKEDFKGVDEGTIVGIFVNQMGDPNVRDAMRAQGYSHAYDSEGRFDYGSLNKPELNSVWSAFSKYQQGHQGWHVMATPRLKDTVSALPGVHSEAVSRIRASGRSPEEQQRLIDMVHGMDAEDLQSQMRATQALQ